MEPASTEPRPTGRAGSLTNPEVVEDVPGHIIPILEREFDDFDSEAAKFLDGQTPETEFIGFRLKQGVYGQRQANVQMVRVKLPFGGITPEQMDTFADVTERYAPLNKSHITTRQNIQIHHVPLDQMTKLIREISAVGLSSREGCGNTVRNVTADPLAGICADEVFDPTPYVGAYVRYFVRHPTTQLMPRKVKTAFDGTASERAISGIHDIAFLARERDGVRGFEVRLGGGTSIMPRVAPTLVEFARADDGEYLKIAEACFRIFDRQDWLRVNRARARIKVLVDRDGIDAVRAMVEEELQGDWVAERDFTPDLFEYDEAPFAPGPYTGGASPNGDRSAFDRFVDANVVPQKQSGFSAVTVKITRGDLDPEQFRGLAQIMRDFTGGHARTTVQQNLVLRWVRDEALYDVWERLTRARPGRRRRGRDHRRRELPRHRQLQARDHRVHGPQHGDPGARRGAWRSTDPLARRIHIKMSGCPNGCSQHHIANIGFYGASIKVGDHTIPAYVAHIGGRYEGGEIAMGTRLKVRLPAKRVPDAVERWITSYLETREGDEPFNGWADRIGSTAFEDQVRDLALPVEFGIDDDEHVRRLEPLGPVRGDSRRGRVRGLIRRA